MENKTVLSVLAGLLVIGLIIQGAMVAKSFGGISKDDIREIVQGEISKIEIPTPEIPDVPDVVVPTAEEIAEKITLPESADNVLLNEYLEDQFEIEFDEIKDHAEDYATEELEDDDYEVVLDYLKTLIAENEEIDEDSVDVDVDDVEIEVTKLGLEDDEDKSARVTFEIEVEYELEEGVRDTFEKDIVVIYDVLFEEGDFDDEEVELVSIA